MTRIVLLVLMVGLLSCSKEDFEITAKADDFFHVETEGAKLPVWVRGNTASRKILLYVNGGPGLSTLDLFEIGLLDWSESLESEFAVAYFDPRGTGNAQGNYSEDDMSLAQSLRDIDAVIAILSDGYDAKIILFGHSYGGYQSLKYGIGGLHPAVSSIISIAGPVVFESELRWAYKAEYLREVANEKIAENERVAFWEEVIDWLDANVPLQENEEKDQWQEYAFEAFTETLPALSLGQALRALFASSYNMFPAYFSSNAEKVLFALIEDSEEDNLLGDLNEIEVPIMFLNGRFDDIVPPGMIQEAFDTLQTPFAHEYHLIPDAGHQPYFDQPDAFEQTVLNYVREH